MAQTMIELWPQLGSRHALERRAKLLAHLGNGSHLVEFGIAGGVGRYAVQLAALAGAMVTALVRDVEKSAVGLRELGAEEVVDTVERDFDLVVDAVGGATFATAIEYLAPRGVVVNLATGSPGEVVSFRAAR